MEIREIKLLLNKFYKGATSLEEENLLREYFLNKKNIPPDLENDRVYFIGLKDYRDNSFPDFNLEKELITVINDQETKVIRLKKSKYWALRIAASIIMIIGTYFLVNKYTSPEPVDTFDNPEIAYLETKKALLYVSQKLNGGTEELQNLEKLTESLENLAKLKEFDKATNMVKSKNQ